MVQSVSVGLFGLEPSQSSIGFGSTHYLCVLRTSSTALTSRVASPAVRL
jgi:hypothetical protein